MPLHLVVESKMIGKLQAIYKARIDEFTDAAQTLKQKYNRFTFVRVAIFLVGIALLILAWSNNWVLGLVGTLAWLYGFYRFIMWHQGLKAQEEHLEQLVSINANEVRVLGHDYQMFENGERFVNPAHAYTLDLDIFGAYSLYQYCNRTTTAIGQARLAEFFQQTADSATIQQRQTAIKELHDKLDWRQHLQAHGTQTKDEVAHLNALKFWLGTESFMLHNRLFQLSLYLAPLWALAALVLGILYLPWWLAILFLIPNILCLQRTAERVNTAHLQTSKAEEILSHYSKLIAHIEAEDFESSLLQQHSAYFKQYAASKELKQLSYYIHQLNVRYNMFAFLLNIGGLWDLHWILRLERWRERNRALLPQWFDSLAEFESLSSFANFYYNNPDFIFPEFQAVSQIEGTALGHPLIHASKRVTNDFESPTQGHIKLITGSNMAGKSTFLRTVGLNLMLAMIGAPVCAKRLRLPRLQVYTSMRTQDALHESTSSFYAELKRLKFIIDAVEQGENIYFLLDEILKGTNSRDRHTGSKALIQQLIKAKGGGIIATHDLELGALEAQYGGAIENLCIEVAIDGQELHFDYKLKKGVSQSFNATLLMQQMGIRIEEQVNTQ